MRIAICEDELEQQQHIEQLIRSWCRDTGCSASYAFFSSAEGLLAKWNEGFSYDIVFFDIHLKGMNGVKASKKLRELDEHLMIVFLTSRIEYVLNGYEVNAWRFLLKPVHPAEFFLCLSKAKERTEKSLDSFIVRSENKLLKLPYDSILYFEAFGHFVSIYTSDHTYEMRMGISQLENTLPEYFYRCHRSYIVNMHHCTCIDEQSLQVGNFTIGYSSKKRDELLKRFMG